MCDSGAFGDWEIELIDGELERVQSPMNLHAMRQAKVVILLAQVFAMEQVRGAAGTNIGHNTMVECDAAILREPVTTNRQLVAADLMLVVEVAESTAKRDVGMKRLKCAAADILGY